MGAIAGWAIKGRKPAGLGLGIFTGPEAGTEAFVFMRNTNVFL
jgi:hypothetical protein